LWVIGLSVGIDLVFCGRAWMGLAQGSAGVKKGPFVAGAHFAFRLAREDQELGEKLNRTLTKWAGAGTLLIGVATSALGGSVTRPGDTVGAAVGIPLPPGIYFQNQWTEDYRATSPHGTAVLDDVPVLVWSTPWTIVGGRLVLSTAPAVPVSFRIYDTVSKRGMFNPYMGAQLAWDLGHNFGVSYLLGGYIDIGSPIGYSSDSLNQRFALSYTGNGWDLTANTIWGIQFDSVTNGRGAKVNPNFLNVDLTATKRFGKWEVGAVGGYSTDLNAPIAAYKKQSQFQLGPLVGYYFDWFVVQAYVTTDLYQKNYGASLISGNLRVTIPLGNPPPPPRAIAP
jgi:hypothetical protein